MNEFNFLHPNASFLLFAVVLLAVFLMVIWKRKERIFLKIADNRTLPKIARFPSKKWFWIKGILLLGAFIFFIGAIAGPRGNPHYQTQDMLGRKKGDLRRKEHEVAFFLDISASMAVKDMRLSKSRLEFAKETIEEVIKGLTGEPVSLYVFTSEVEKKVPSTIDTLYARLIVQNVKIHDIGAEGTDFSKVISKIISEIASSKKGKRTTFVILTDGESTEGKLIENLDLKKDMARSEVIMIGVGTLAGGTVPDVLFNGNVVVSKREDAALESLAKEFSGNYFIAESSSPLFLAQKILKEIAREPAYVKIDALQQEEKSNELLYDEYFRYPLIAGLALFILAIILPFTTKQKEG